MWLAVSSNWGCLYGFCFDQDDARPDEPGTGAEIVVR